MKIILLGKPLSGKGTQASFISEKLHIPHISTGELLRKEVEAKTVIGKKVSPLLKQGKLVPDKLMFSILEKRLPQTSFILDGFPRDLLQAKILGKVTTIDLVIDVFCSDKIILKRAASRMSCETCGHIYGLNVVPKKKGICDDCRGKLVRRVDDNAATVKKRLQLYREETKQLIFFYTKQGTYFAVKGEDPIAFVQKKIMRKIESIK